MSVSKSDCSFYAKTDKGFGTKVTVDILKNLLGRVLHIQIDKNGIATAQGSDATLSRSQYCASTEYPAGTWGTYYCKEGYKRSLEVNLSELCIICKNIKKKYLLIIYILENEQNSLYFVPIPPNQGVDGANLKRRLPISDINLDFTLFKHIEENFNGSFHAGLSGNLFQSMCKNFSSGTKSTVFNFLMYESGYIYCDADGTFSDCIFENDVPSDEEKKHKESYKKYLTYMTNNSSGYEDDDEFNDEIEQILSYKFFSGTFNCKFLKNIQKLSGYGSTIHVFTNPIERDSDNPIQPLLIKCQGVDTFSIKIFAKSNEQIKYEKDISRN